MEFELDPNWTEKDIEATQRIRNLAIKLGLPEPQYGEPFNYVMIGILEKLAE